MANPLHFAEPESLERGRKREKTRGGVVREGSLNRLALALAFVVLAGASAVHAQDPEPRTQPEAGSGSDTESLDVDTEAAEEATADTSSEDRDKLTREMAWHTELKDAVAEARKQNKLVFWVQILGKMDGET